MTSEAEKEKIRVKDESMNIIIPRLKTLFLKINHVKRGELYSSIFSWWSHNCNVVYDDFLSFKTSIRLLELHNKCTK